jgi:hypothetical protein
MALPAPGKLPSNTPISRLGLSSAQLAKLTPAARKLTKGDLVALQKWGSSGGKGAAPDHLTVADLQSLKKAVGDPATFATQAKKRSMLAADTVACCCSCCPCCSCTAAAEISPVRVR